MLLQSAFPKTASGKNSSRCAFASGGNRPASRAASRVCARRRAKLASGKSLYNYFRDYDPSLGRYVQSDPIGLNSGSLSTFGYVDSSPLDLVDLLGLEASAGLGNGSSGLDSTCGCNMRAPSFFALTTFESARRDTSLDDSVRRGELTRIITMPAIAAGLSGSAIGLGGSASAAVCRAIPELVPNTAQLCQKPVFAVILGASVCMYSNGAVGSSRNFVRQRESLQEVRESIGRTLRRDTGNVPRKN